MMTQTAGKSGSMNFKTLECAHYLFQIRLWRKNRSPIVCEKGEDGRHRCCRGVDLNRNFDFHFKGDSKFGMLHYISIT